MPDNTLSTLDQIRTKIRRLTKSPSAAQITDAEIDNYINTFVLYDFPAQLRLLTLKTTLTFYTQPYIDVYSGDDIAVNFNNMYTNVYSNVYVSGYKQEFSQNREEFFSLNPRIETQKKIDDGDGLIVNYTGILTPARTLAGRVTYPTRVLRNSISFSAINDNTLGLTMHDVPNDPDDGMGVFAGDVGAASWIDYRTGEYDITFNSAPGNGEPVYVNAVYYSPGRPTSILYFNNTFTFRPVPDHLYRVDLEVETRPTEMLALNQMPELSQWFQYIAYGAAKKIFEDRMDMDSVQMIMPEFKKQETLVNRRTIDQQNKEERAATIYTDISKGYF